MSQTKSIRQYLVLRKYSILLYQNCQNSHIMCSFVSSYMLWFPTALQPTAKNYTLGQSTGQMTVFPPHCLWLAVIANVLLTARLLCIPFSNTLSSSGLFCCQDNTPSPPPSFSSAFSQSHKALKENENNFSKNVESLDARIHSFYFHLKMNLDTLPREKQIHPNGAKAGE